MAELRLFSQSPNTNQFQYDTTILLQYIQVVSMCITIVIYISCNTLIEYMKKYSDKRVCGTVNLEAEQSQIWFISKSRILKSSF